jgi:subfamily B ATP-binding cassette protein MsbA
MEENMTLKKDKSPDYKQLKQLLPYIKPYRMRLVVGIVMGVLYGATTSAMIAALGWATGMISGDTISAGIPTLPDAGSGTITLNQVIKTVALLPIVATLQGIIFFIGKYFVEWVGNRVVADLRMSLFKHIHTLPMQFFTKSRSGDLITRITSDTGALTTLVSNVIADAIRSPFTLLGCIAVMVWTNWQLSIIALVVFPVCIAPVALIGKRIRKASKRGQEGIGNMLSVVQESIGGAIVVKAFQTEEEENDRFSRFNSTIFKMTMRQTRGSSLNEPLMTGVSTLGLAGIVIYAYVNNLSIATLVTFGAAMANMYKPAKKLSQLHMRISKIRPSVERIFEILNTPNSIQDTPNAIPFEGTIENISFQNISFAYNSGKTVLKQINLSVDAGKCTAFIGSSGAGKTTLVNLIPRFFDPTEGAVLLNGKDIRDYTLHSLRKQIGIVTQQTILFNRSIAENISYGSPNATQEQIVDAAKRANAHQFIQEMENGYDTEIGERGALLSGGMAQRIAIARALLRNPPILILDEATSALDNESERLVQAALNELMKNRTVFVIAHRLSTIIHSDTIVVMDKGEIVEKGTHAELLENGGKYKYFYNMQFSEKTNGETNVGL